MHHAYHMQAPLDSHLQHHQGPGPQDGPSSIVLLTARFLLTCIFLYCILLQAPLDSIRGTIEALGPELDLPAVFRSSRLLTAAAAIGPYKLRSVVCYFQVSDSS